MTKKALIIENPQIDYFEGGALEVPNANRIIPILNDLIPKYEIAIITLDWHPATHISFAANHPWRQIGQIIEINQIPIELKPIHCVQHTFGAKVHPLIQDSAPFQQILKGIEHTTEDHSAFFNKGAKPTQLLSVLKAKGIEELHVAGMILEDNLFNTIIDGQNLGYSMTVIRAASTGRISKDSSNKFYEYIKSQGVVSDDAEINK